jgi:hypothetical protein
MYTSAELYSIVFQFGRWGIGGAVSTVQAGLGQHIRALRSDADQWGTRRNDGS